MGEQAYEMAYTSVLGFVPENSHKGWKRAGPTLAMRLDRSERVVFVQDHATGYTNASKKYIRCKPQSHEFEWYVHCKFKDEFFVARPLACRVVDLKFEKAESGGNVIVMAHNAFTSDLLVTKELPAQLTLAKTLLAIHDVMQAQNLITGPTQLKLAALTPLNKTLRTMIPIEKGEPKKKKARLAKE